MGSRKREHILRNATPFSQPFRHNGSKIGAVLIPHFMVYLSWFESRTRKRLHCLFPLARDM
jgi:hypothetical protein